MDYTDFLARVRQGTGLSREAAGQLTGAFLETLGQRLLKVHRQHLAAQLPGELKAHVLRHRRADQFSLEAFYIYVSARARLSTHEAIRFSRVAGRVLAQAVAPGELRDIFAELPPEFGELVGDVPTTITNTTVDTHELYKRL